MVYLDYFLYTIILILFYLLINDNNENEGFTMISPLQIIKTFIPIDATFDELFPSKSNDDADEISITPKDNPDDKVVVNKKLKKYKQVNNAITAFNASFEIANKLSYMFIKMPYDIIHSIGKSLVKLGFIIKDICKPIVNGIINLYYVFKIDKIVEIFINMIEFMLSFPTNFLNLMIGFQNKVMNYIT